ncbi:tyrosine-protein phosphatase [Craterilacuibacter sp.]|uniref:tyrosine-protein phosphatase n=1 Tax=Craterilacuibacter sp. TaxID=2870909 RepID=UPI003F2DE9AE
MSQPDDACQGLPLKRGRLFRAGVLSTLDTAQITPGRALGIRHIIDFRSVRERDSELCLWGTLLGVRSQRAPVAADLRANDTGSNALIASFARHPGADSAHALMRALYCGFADAFLPHLRTLFEPLAQGEPLLVHCTAGKDRTGFACALIARAAGVSHPQVTDDYLTHGRQAAYAQHARLRTVLAGYLGTTPDDATIAIFAGVNEAFLSAAFDRLVTRYGSIDAYLAAGGVDAALLGRARAALLR